MPVEADPDLTGRMETRPSLPHEPPADSSPAQDPPGSHGAKPRARSRAPRLPRRHDPIKEPIFQGDLPAFMDQFWRQTMYHGIDQARDLRMLRLAVQCACTKDLAAASMSMLAEVLSVTYELQARVAAQGRRDLIAMDGHNPTIRSASSVPAGTRPSSICRFRRAWRTASHPWSYSPTWRVRHSRGRWNGSCGA